jgi:hypothetical protein
MDHIDLDLDNYNLADLLNLFKLQEDFQAAELKEAKKIVLHMHPDKSQLDKKYFLFFSAAYKVLCSIFFFRNKSTAGYNPDITYNQFIEKHDFTKDATLEKQLQPLLQLKPARFNEKFNELFVKYHVQDAQTENGYGDFLRSDEGLDQRTCKTLSEMGNIFEDKKTEIQALTLKREVQGSGHGNIGSDLTGEKPEYYSAELFSSLPYEDLKRAHIESVVPVTQADYLSRPKFNSVDELLRDNNYNNVTPPSLDTAKTVLLEQQRLQTTSDVHRAFTLAKQDEKARKANNGFLTGFKQLKF